MSEIKKYCEGLDCAICDEKEPCIYKIANELEQKLANKEQECERLKKKLLEILGKEGLRQSEKEFYEQQLDQLKKENEELKKKILAEADYNLQLSYDIEKVDELEKENEELKEKVKSLERMTGIFSARLCKKYKQALTEIKEIAEKQMEICSCKFDLNNYESGCRGCASKDARVISKQILEKCEVIDED